MYEKLDKLRADVKRWEDRIEDDKAKLKQAQNKLQEAENTQILADVGALNLSPEQLAEFLKLATAGKLGGAGTESGYVPKEEKEDLKEDDYNFESEDNDDEEN